MTATISTGTERPVVDLLDPELYRRNPHDVWEWMRRNEPVYRDARNGLWGVTRHSDIQDVERRSSVFVSGLGYRANHFADEVNMIAQDDPRHRQQRMLVQPELTQKAVARRAPEIAARVERRPERRDRRGAGRPAAGAHHVSSARIPRGGVAATQVVERATDAHRHDPARRTSVQ